MKASFTKAKPDDIQAAWELLLEDQALRSMPCRAIAKELNTIGMKTAATMKVVYDFLSLKGILSQNMGWLEAWNIYKNIQPTKKEQ